MIAELAETRQELDALEKTKVELESKLDVAEDNAGTLQGDVSRLRSRMAELESNTATLVTQLLASGKELEDLRSSHTALENSFQAASDHSGDLEIELHAARMRLDIAEAESLEAMNKFLLANKELTSLRDENAKLDTSGKELLARLATAEEELNTAREYNSRLGAFLERVESDMTKAQTAVEDTEKRYQDFVQGAQVKLEAAETSKLRFKNRLTERNNELEILINENSDLHQQIGDQTRELGALKKGKGKLVEELSKKEKYIEELGSSAEKRLEFMKSSYNGLKQQFEEQQSQLQRLENDHETALRLEAELEKKMTEIEEMQHNREESAASFAALEQEVGNLKKDKKAFEKLIATLNEKMRHLEVLDEWAERNEQSLPNRPGSQRHLTIQDEAYDTAPSSPMSAHTRSSVGLGLHISGQHERPVTRASTVSHEGVDPWTRQVEEARMQRNEAAILLSGMKKSRHNLKKTLRDTDAHLHRLEKETKAKNSPNLLRKKSRPMISTITTHEQGCTSNSPLTVAHSPQTPTRRKSLHGFGFSPRSNANQRHSTYHFPPYSEPRSTMLTSPERPKTSHSIRNRLSGRKSVGDELTGSPKEHKRRWSHGLRNLFHKDA